MSHGRKGFCVRRVIGVKFILNSAEIANRITSPMLPVTFNQRPKNVSTEHYVQNEEEGTN